MRRSEELDVSLPDFLEWYERALREDREELDADRTLVHGTMYFLVRDGVREKAAQELREQQQLWCQVESALTELRQSSMTEGSWPRQPECG